MSGRHTGQNHFHGSTGTMRRVPKGGLQTVVARDVIGAFPCWCQGVVCWVDLTTGMQTWPGKERGEPHPRIEDIERIDEMVHTLERIGRHEVKTFPKKVADLLLTLVNECGIRCRPTDGETMLLYPPDGKSRPFKVSAKRPEEQTLTFIYRKFMAVYDIHLPKREEKEQEIMRTPTQATPETARPTPPPAAFSAKKPASTTARPTALPAHPEGDKPDTSVWQTLPHSMTGEPMPNWETNGKVFRCVTCRKAGVEYVATERRQLGGHTRSAHQREGLDTAETRAKSAETRRYNRLQDAVAAAVESLQQAIGTPARSEELEALTARVAELETALAEANERAAKAEHRAEEAETRIALLKEQFEGVFKA